MPTLELVEVGTWTDSALTGQIARWGDAIATWRRVTATNTTRFADTGAAGAFTGFDIVGATSGEVYVRPGQGDDTHLYLGQSDNVDLIRIDTAGTITDIGNKTGTGGAWNMTHAGHPSYVIASHSVTGGSRITRYTKPGGGAGTDLVVSASSFLFETIEVDPATGDMYASTFFSGASRGVRKYDDTGTLLWDASIPNASDGTVYEVAGLALTSQGLVAYTVDNDQPGGTRVNNNWWLIDPDGGTVQLLDVTLDGVAFETWVDGSDTLADRDGCLSVLDDQVYIGASLSRVYGGGFATAGGWRVGRVGWPRAAGTTLTATLIPEATSSSVGWQTKWNPATISGSALSDNQAAQRRWEVVEAGTLTIDLTLTWLDVAAGKDGIGTREVSFVRQDSTGAFIEELQDSQSAVGGVDTVGVVQGSMSVNAGDRLVVTAFHNAGGNITIDDGSISLTLVPA